MIPRLKPGLLVALTIWAAVSAQAQGSASTGKRDGMPADGRIAAALGQVSADRIQADIEKLVSFHTRVTLSATDQASMATGRGIGAAREWIKSEFERYSRECGGCLELKTDSFTEAPAGRIRLPASAP